MGDQHHRATNIVGAFIEQSRKLLTDSYLPRIERAIEELSVENLWWRANPESNSIGNLILHLNGNVRQWIVSGLGGDEDNYGPPPQPAIDPQTKQRSDGLWQLLYQRATQGTNVDANDPTIKAQTDAYRAEQTRAERNYLSDLAERSSQYANLQGEQRMAAEHLGQNVAGFQAELMSRELTAKRAEITQALQQLGGQLSDEEKLALEQALGAIDAQLKSRGLDIQASGQNQSYDANLRRLGLDEWDRNNYWDYARTFGG